MRNPILQDTIIDREYVERHPPNEETVLSVNTANPRPMGVVHSYCYHTIGEVECYAYLQREES